MSLRQVFWQTQNSFRNRNHKRVPRLRFALEPLESRQLLATDLEIHNWDFNIPSQGPNELEGWIGQRGCCFGTWDGAPFFGGEASASGPDYARLGNENPVDMISDSGRQFPIGRFEPNTTYTLTWSVGVRSQSERVGDELVGPAVDDELRLYYFDAQANDGAGTYEIVAAVPLAELGYDATSQTLGWNDYRLVFETGPRGAKEPWLDQPIAVGYSRTDLWPMDDVPFQWQSNVDDVRLQSEPSRSAAAIVERAREVLLDEETGDARFLGAEIADLFERPDELPPQASPVAVASRFIGAYKELFGVDEQELIAARTDAMAQQRSVVRLKQQYTADGEPPIEVWGAEAVVQLDGQQNVVSVSSTLRGRLNEARLNPRNLPVTVEEAESTALDEVASSHQVDDLTSLLVEESKLVVFDAKLLRQPGPAAPRLAQYVRVLSKNPLTSTEPVTNQLIDSVIIVDRRSGGVLLTIDRIESDDVPGLETYSADFPSFPDPNVDQPTCDSTDAACVAGTPSVRSAHIFAQNAYHYFQEKHGRDSFDNNGATIYSAVIGNVQGEPRAAWTYPSGGSLEAAIYLGGTAFAEDVVGHEFTHGVTNHSSGLEYLGQSGAINESLSDIWGEFIDQEYTLGENHPSGLSDNDSEEVKWLLGEDVIGSSQRARRNMKDPMEFGDPDSMLSYACVSGDHGGVHTNSGINNKAAYLMTDGGTHNGITVTGIGRDQVSQLYYRVQTAYLTSLSDYSQLASLMMYATADLGFSSFEQQQVANAIRAVEMDAILNCRPNLSEIEDQVIEENEATSALEFSVDDVDTNVGALTLSATSDDQLLIPDGNIVLAGGGVNRTITVTPIASEHGSAKITLTALDGVGGITQEVFEVVVNGTPSISAIDDQVLNEDTPTLAIPFLIDDPETSGDDLIVTAMSSDPSLLPTENLVLEGSGNNRSITVTPAEDRFGDATVTVTVEDSLGAKASHSFDVSVASVNDVPVVSVPVDLSVLDEAELTFATENGNAIVVSDVDAGANELGIVLSVDSGTLTLATSVGLTTVAGDGTGAMTFSGPLSAINSALDGLRFTPEEGVTGATVLSIFADDLGSSGSGGAMVGSGQVNIDVVPFNVPPFILSEIADQIGSEDTPISMIPLEVFDFETAAEDLLIALTSDNPSLIPDENITLGGLGENRTLTLTPLAEQAGTATITVEVTDQEGESTLASFMVTIEPVNDAPVNVYPVDQITLTDVPLEFSTGFGNAISTTDVDAGNEDIEMQLVVDSGYLIAGSTAGLTSIAGHGSAAMTIAGTLSAVNASLDGLTYVPDVGYSGAVQLAITTDDLGHSGPDGSAMDSDVLRIDVVAKPATMTESNDAIPIFFTFPEEVSGFELDDLSLLRCTNGCEQRLPGAAVLTKEDPLVWKLDGLPEDSGIYVLTLPADSGITGPSGPPLTEDLVVTWTLRPGDSDRNGRFDKLDIVHVLQCGTYNTGTPANWTCGDWDGNGVFDQLDIILALKFITPEFNTP